MGLSLPPIPPELKSIAPYIQRAEELSSNDPVISYWCAYYAAQQGIGLKLKDAAARTFLLELLGLLEHLKNEIGANDAVHDEPAAAAYIENFALRVFANADSEDRRGASNKNTAKKFVAASNFLELLKTFDGDKVGIDLPSIQEKITYAKWKAVDIAKAIREGRKPTPGPAAPEPEAELELPSAPVPDVAVVPPTTPPAAQSPLPSRQSPPTLSRNGPAPANLTDLPPVGQAGFLGADLSDGLSSSQPPTSPGGWSTAATPGTPGFPMEDGEEMSPIVSPSTSRRMAFVSEEMEGRADDELGVETTPPASAGKSVHFAPSAAASAPEYPSMGMPSAPPFDPIPGAAFGTPSAPPMDLPPALPAHRPGRPSAVSAAVHPGPSPIDPRRATVTMPPPDLTPQMVSRVQKHCRYAISALDYEDSTQAIKELRAALRMLEGGPEA